MNVSTNDLKTGMTLDLDHQLWQVVDFQHVKPGKGHAFVRTKLKNVRSGAVLDRTFRADEKVGLAIVERKEMQYLYDDGHALVFMDTGTYEQIHVPKDTVGDMTGYLVEGAMALIAMHDGVPIGVELPAAVVIEVAQTDPGVKGDRVSGAMKPAVLQTGLTVRVPLFVGPGDKVKVDTRSGEYLTREQ
ncbi:MAG TPA: elongation factor P [Actinomycetota bacterium]